MKVNVVVRVVALDRGSNTDCLRAVLKGIMKVNGMRLGFVCR